MALQQFSERVHIRLKVLRTVLLSTTGSRQQLSA